MMDSLQDIERVLDGTVLQGLRCSRGVAGLVTIDVPTPERAGLEPEEMLAAWRAARQVLDQTGRWPVVADPEDLTARYIAEDDTEQSLLALDSLARSLDPWPVFRDHWRARPVDRDAFVADFGHVFGDVFPLADHLDAELTLPVPEVVAERWLYDRVLADDALLTAAEARSDVPRLVGLRNWYCGWSVQIALLPTSSPWLLPRWMQYYGAEGAPDAMSAVLWRWQRDWGAELVACWGTMLELVVERPPSAGDEAWEVAGQIRSLACSLSSSQLELALALPRSGAWFLHCRP